MPRAKGTSPARTIAYFDVTAERYASLYDDVHTPAGFSFAVRRERVLEQLHGVTGRVLDVGCGPGVMAPAVRAKGLRFSGIDPADAMLRRAAAACDGDRGVDLTLGTAEWLPYADQAFGAVVCMGVLERLPDDAHALDEMRRVLRPGGIVVLTVPNRSSPSLAWRDGVFYPLVGWLRSLHRLRGSSTADEPVRGFRRYGRRSLTATFQELGFAVEEVTYCVYNPLPAPLDAISPRFTSAVLQTSERLHRTRLGLIGAVMVVRARKIGDV